MLTNSFFKIPVPHYATLPLPNNIFSNYGPFSTSITHIKAHTITARRYLSIPRRLFKHVVIAGKISPLQKVPNSISLPPYAKTGDASPIDEEGRIEIKTKEEIEGMRKSCKLARAILQYAGSLVAPGVTTDEIDAKVHKAIIEHGAYPSPLNYDGFPKSVCTSVNEVAAHGIPDDRPLVEGDIISIDVTVYYQGFHGDTAATFIVGQKVDDNAKRLIEVAKKYTEAGINAVRPGGHLRDIGHAIQACSRRYKLQVIPEACGHGIGKHFHTAPWVFHVDNDSEGILQPGMTFTIEPIVVEKSPNFIIWDDNWTFSSKDGGWCAQFEHTILVTELGVEILT